MKEIIEKELVVGSKIRMLRRQESGAWAQSGVGIIRSFLYSKIGAVSARVEIFGDDGKATGILESLPINSNSFKLANW